MYVFEQIWRSDCVTPNAVFDVHQSYFLYFVWFHLLFFFFNMRLGATMRLGYMWGKRHGVWDTDVQWNGPWCGKPVKFEIKFWERSHSVLILCPWRSTGGRPDRGAVAPAVHSITLELFMKHETTWNNLIFHCGDIWKYFQKIIYIQTVWCHFLF